MPELLPPREEIKKLPEREKLVLSLYYDEGLTLAEIGEVLLRFGPYAPRLSSAFNQVRAGDTHLFTGVMCNSYHDIWMELHEDLLLTQRIDRADEGSF